jgi:hypothetical protein
MEKVTRASIVLWCAIFASGCSVDERMEAVPQEEEASRIAIFIPGAEEVRVYSTATADENRIEDCFVVVFDQSGVFRTAEKIDVLDITNNGEATALLPQLSTVKLNIDDRVYVLCNTGLSAAPTGIIESNINSKFPPAKDYYFSGEALPMSGSVRWSPTAASTVTLTRAVAKVQVRLGETFSVGNLESFPYLTLGVWDADFFKYNVRRCGFIAGNYAGRSDILQPSSGLSQTLSGNPSFFTYEKYIRLMQFATADSMAIYISEYPNSTKDREGTTIPDDVFDVKRQYLFMLDRVDNNILGNDDGLVGLWRLDFYDAANKKYLDIKRNHTYTFTINRIQSMPYILPVGALGNSTLSGLFQIPGLSLNVPASNVEFTIEVKEEDNWANAIYSNGQYAVLLSAGTINDGNINLPFKIKVYTPAGIDPLSNGSIAVYDSEQSPAGGTASAFTVYRNGSSVTDYANLPFEFPADGTTDVITFKFDHLHARASYFNDAGLYIYLGNISRKIPIRLNVP